MYHQGLMGPRVGRVSGLKRPPPNRSGETGRWLMPDQDEASDPDGGRLVEVPSAQSLAAAVSANCWVIAVLGVPIWAK